ncbi:unnamed protein product, partial [Mesorhabditis belari]|uniref:Death domain-containing protein n=1 Tax=Mesorhabditis belari TaxID=2138241 RepID=A0AAF3FBS0_9BILA
MAADTSISSESRRSSIAKSHSDTQMFQPPPKPENSRGLFIEEISSPEIGTGDKMWLLLGSRLTDEHPEIGLKFREEEKNVERILQKDKLLIFTVPQFSQGIFGEGSLKLKTQETSVTIPIILKERPIVDKEETRASTSIESVSHLFAFAENGDSQELTRPFAPHFSRADNEGNTVLHVAARNQQSFAMRTFLLSCDQLDQEEKKVLLNKRNGRGQTALHCAIRAGDTDSVHYLLHAGASIEIPDNHQNSAFHYLGDTYSDAIFKEILETGSAMIEELEKKNQQGQTPLIVAVSRLKLSLVEMLLECGISVDGSDSQERTALMHAITMNDPDIVFFLLQKGADANHEDIEGETPLLLAKQISNYYVMGALLDAGADPFRKNAKGISLSDIDDQTIQGVIGGQRISPELKTIGANHSSLFGRSSTKHVEGGDETDDEDSVGEEIPIHIDQSPQTSRRSTGRPIQVPMSSSLEDGGIAISPEQGPSSSTARRRPRKSRFETSTFVKDDISSLDYLTRLRLSKILDTNAKWQDLAMELECAHMTELIQICADEHSSPTMIFLDQYEMIPGSKVSLLREAFSHLGLKECVSLIDTRVTY